MDISGKVEPLPKLRYLTRLKIKKKELHEAIHKDVIEHAGTLHNASISPSEQSPSTTN